MRLDKEQRGGDPEGMDGRDSLNGEPSSDMVGSDDNIRNCYHNESHIDEEKYECNTSSHHVVAKAENLELLEEVDPIGFVGSAVAVSIVKARSPKGMTTLGVSSQKSRDPSTSWYAESFEGESPAPAMVSPSCEDYMHVTTNRHSSSSHCHERTTPSPLSSPHIMTQRMSGKDISSAFLNLMSPLSFENVSFTLILTNLFASPTNESAERLHKYNAVSPTKS